MCSTGKFSPKLAWSLRACTKIHCPAPGLPAGGERGTGPWPALHHNCPGGHRSPCRAPQHPQSCQPSSRKAPECSGPSPGETRGLQNLSSAAAKATTVWQDYRTSLLSLGKAAKGQAHTSPFLGLESHCSAPKQAAGTPATGKQFCSQPKLTASAA